MRRRWRPGSRSCLWRSALVLVKEAEARVRERESWFGEMRVGDDDPYGLWAHAWDGAQFPGKFSPSNERSSIWASLSGSAETPFLCDSGSAGLGKPGYQTTNFSNISVEMRFGGLNWATKWYVSNVSIIFDAPCLFIHHLLCVLLHFVAFLYIF
jgi:hypothetical protein